MWSASIKCTSRAQLHVPCHCVLRSGTSAQATSQSPTTTICHLRTVLVPTGQSPLAAPLPGAGLTPAAGRPTPSCAGSPVSALHACNCLKMHLALHGCNELRAACMSQPAMLMSSFLLLESRSQSHWPAAHAMRCPAVPAEPRVAECNPPLLPSRYLLNTSAASFQEAQAHCQVQGGHLVSYRCALVRPRERTLSACKGCSAWWQHLHT
jgi:hypothetical protein